MLEIRSVSVAAGEREVLKGLDLTVRTGEIHALMGPNGSGKSTLAFALMGHPRYRIHQGEVLWNGENVLEMKPEERAAKGLFLGFQYPIEVKGVRLSYFLWMASNALRIARGEESVSPVQFRKSLLEVAKHLDIDDDFLDRYVNDGFSGGERKRAEILQMSVLKPRLAILDETDSGLDIDALRTVSDGINQAFHPGMGIVLITHYQRILQYIRPHFVHVLVGGRIIKEGGYELSEELERDGYAGILASLGISEPIPAEVS